MHGRGGATAQRHQNRLMVDSHTQLSLPDIGLAAIARAHDNHLASSSGRRARATSGPGWNIVVRDAHPTAAQAPNGELLGDAS